MAIPFLAVAPLRFSYDPDTGLLSANIRSGLVSPLTQEQYELEALLLLSPDISKRLLDDLPQLARLLEQAAKGPTKPSSVQ
jgi:hypothetical protein